MKHSAMRGVVVLAAGLGKRMHSSLPKVLHEVGGQPLIFHILSQIQKAAPDVSVAVVVGHGRHEVESAIRGEARFKPLDLHFIVQEEQKGTGHALLCVMDSEWGRSRAPKNLKEKASILVLPGDAPLISKDLVEQMIHPLADRVGLRLLSCEMENPTGYGRVIRTGAQGQVKGIVEEKDLRNSREAAIREVCVSIYLFQFAFLKEALQKLSTRNAQGEYYLTDVVGQAGKRKLKVEGLIWKTPSDLQGINDPWELAHAARVMNERVIRDWAQKGVRFLDPWSVQLDVSVQLGEGVVVHPGVILRGKTRIDAYVVLGPRVVLTDVVVGAGAYIKTGTVAEESQIGAEAQIGPYAHLRPGSKIGMQVKVGNFVEIKNAVIEAGTSVAHLSYVGDAEIGKGVNIGCGFVTCNFDGRVIDGQRKHKTVIEDEVFLGSDCQVVAPIRIGRGAYIASGSTITEDVPSEDLAIARSRQVNKKGYAKKLRQNK